MNMAEKLDEISRIVQSSDLCAEAMVREIETILDDDD